MEKVNTFLNMLWLGIGPHSIATVCHIARPNQTLKQMQRNDSILFGSQLAKHDRRRRMNCAQNVTPGGHIVFHTQEVCWSAVHMYTQYSYTLYLPNLPWFSDLQVDHIASARYPIWHSFCRPASLQKCRVVPRSCHWATWEGIIWAGSRRRGQCCLAKRV